MAAPVTPEQEPGDGMEIPPYDHAQGQRLDSIAAAARLARSPRVRGAVWAAAVWVASFVLYPLAVGVVGWLGAKLETRMDVDTLTGKVAELSGHIAVLTNRTADVGKQIAALSSPPGPGENDKPGPIYQLRSDMRYAQRNVVKAIGIGLCTARDRKGKFACAAPLVQAYDKRYERSKDPTYSADEAIAKVAPKEDGLE